MEAMKKTWDALKDGRETHLYTLKNAEGYVLTLSDFGARIVGLEVPTEQGDSIDVVIGYDTAQAYEANDGYLGAVVGRVGNRLGGGMIRVDESEYRISRNEGNNTLHGGEVGFDQAVWETEIVSDQELCFRHTSPDGDQGFPGELKAEVRYILTDDGQIELLYRMETDQATPVNLTNHVYFNLNGGEGTIVDHEAYLEADFYTPVDREQLPDGTIVKVQGTAFDFTEAKPIREALESDDAQIQAAGGVDHNFVLRKEERGELTLAAAIASEESGIVLTCYTTQPGIQFYTGNFLTEREGKRGQTIQKQSGFCLETQHFPNSMLQTHFPSIVLYPGEQLETQTVFGFVGLEEYRQLQEILSMEQI